MAFQSVPETVEGIIRYLQNGRECALTFYAQKVGGYTQTDVDNLATNLDAWAGAVFKTWLSNQTQYVGAYTRGLENAVDFQSSATANAGAGTNPTAPCPNNVAFCVKRTSGLTGRSARGRVYLPVPQGFLDVNEDSITTSAAAYALAMLEDIGTYINSAGFIEVLVSRYTSGALRPVATVLEVVGYEVVNRFLDSQRRRLPR